MKEQYIYIQPKDLIELDTIKHKYKVSISTIVATVYNHYCAYGQQQVLENTYINQEKSKKIHIKPKIMYETNKPNMALSNAIHIYLNKNELAYMKLDLDKIKALRAHINKEFNETKEEFWNYNHDIRTYNRFQKRFEKRKQNESTTQ